MNYSLLIVDDEELIREGLRARLEYLDITFSRIYEAASGKEALEIMQNSPVDIVVTDIRMPQMSGLELIEESRRLHPGCYYMVLSGYSEFEYAKQALKLGAKAYLLKPLSNDELQQEFRQLFEIMEKEKSVKRALKKHQHLSWEKKEYSLEKEVNRFLTGSVQDMNAFPGLKGQLFQGEYSCYLTIVNIERCSYETSKFQEKDIEILQFSIKNVFEEIPMDCRKLLVEKLSDMNQMYAVFLWKKGERTLRMRGEVEQLFLKMQSVFLDKMEISLSFGVSALTDSLGPVQEQQAQTALKQRMIYGKSGIYFFEDRKLSAADQIPNTELNQLNRLIERQELGKVQGLLHELFSVGREGKYSSSYFRVIWVRVLNMLLWNFNPKNDPYASMEKLLVSFYQIDTFETIQEAEQKLWELILECVQTEKMTETDSKSKIYMAIRYIQEHYYEDIAVNRLAEKFGMSPNYFSSIFKKEMHQSAVNYISEYRVKKALEYLTGSDWSVVDIAKKVGYEDSQYFFRVFKKSTGVTPLQYRQKHRREQD